MTNTIRQLLEEYEQAKSQFIRATENLKRAIDEELAPPRPLLKPGQATRTAVIAAVKAGAGTAKEIRAAIGYRKRNSRELGGMIAVAVRKGEIAKNGDGRYHPSN
jgi:ribosomal protein L13E